MTQSDIRIRWIFSDTEVLREDQGNSDQQWECYPYVLALAIGHRGLDSLRVFWFADRSGCHGMNSPCFVRFGNLF